jgi:hypothetical protein
LEVGVNKLTVSLVELDENVDLKRPSGLISHWGARLFNFHRAIGVNSATP